MDETQTLQEWFLCVRFKQLMNQNDIHTFRWNNIALCGNMSFSKDHCQPRTFSDAAPEELAEPHLPIRKHKALTFTVKSGYTSLGAFVRLPMESITCGEQE